MPKKVKFSLALLMLALTIAGCGAAPTKLTSGVAIILNDGETHLSAQGELSPDQIAVVLKAAAGRATFQDGTEIEWENRAGTVFFTDDAGAGPISLLPQHLKAYQDHVRVAGQHDGRVATQGVGVTPYNKCNFWFLWCWSSSSYDSRWSAATIPYGYAPGTPADLRAEFEEAAGHWNASLKEYRDQYKPSGRFPRWVFNPRHPERVEVAFTNVGGKGSSAYGGESEFVGFGNTVGTQYLKINANPDFPRPLGLYLHEMGHVAGLLHEHQRCDRDEAITIKTDSVFPDRLNAFGKMCQSNYGSYTPYDYESVMHYPKKAFSRDGKDVIVAKPGARALGRSELMGLQLDLSEGDLRALVEMYSR
ncbi:M12 family metallopeptidase [Deinococcus peraridilitoris]|uniref:Astacin (Peptidase family M12A) n=1 Tax=Deinococcus peraridilitoris (strain DSM 19664 / LMG 22246 / CIP 109416 / KR-200) TaxID=937777 RepID=L0A3Z5_DEIPD|nr:M12 family metallopeptidase [Deinococcus peraridilitoris]AFZ68139.1 Astacin (Peptidase family M12A) [Deinococcus peraridilitoris DSM 19664]